MSRCFESPRCSQGKVLPLPSPPRRSYHLEVFYKCGQTMTQEHWFVKIPLGLQTVAMDERELVMYNTIFPRLQVTV